jgi:CheY-like chemotaxis protein
MTTNKKRLLIVDDNEEIHADFKKILVPLIIHKDSETQELEKELFGDDDNHDKEVVEIPSYDIDDAYQGEDAVSMVDRAESEGNPYSLIFMDIRMPPGMDGIETIKKIWDKNPDAEVVICTAYSDYSWNQILKMLGQTDR